MGASIVDYLGKGTYLFGFGLGDGIVVVVGFVMIAMLVGYLVLSQYGVQASALIKSNSVDSYVPSSRFIVSGEVEV